MKTKSYLTLLRTASLVLIGTLCLTPVAFAQPLLINFDDSTVLKASDISSRLDSMSLKQKQLLAISMVLNETGIAVEAIAIRSGFRDEASIFSQIDSSFRHMKSSFTASPEDGFAPFTLELVVTGNKYECIGNVLVRRNNSNQVSLALIRYCPDAFWQLAGNSVVIDQRNVGVKALRKENFNLN